MHDATQHQRELSDAVDAVLLNVIKNGQVVTDNEGNAVLDGEGNPVTVPPSAAYIRAAMERLKMVGHVTPAAGKGGAVEELRREMAARGTLSTNVVGRIGEKRPLPPLSDADDRATG